MRKIRLECSEANHICDKNQYNEASLWEKIRLTIHLIYCRACRKYTKNNNKLTKLIKKSDTESLDVSEKEKIEVAFERELTKQQH